ncbi:hypothetical protein [Thioalkalivibrio sp. ALJ3]|uniref:hypothetical protein n=1 Tax=Thioalkalivibrio sp. ALJ3 TaxID=1240557 RepID=UPI00039C7320|nr:hypothetical protein [Thioalkalivibrio sp. ALJ3]
MIVPVLDLHSEPYGATGNIGENFRKLLGAPTLDPLQTVIRESVQNIADAAKLGRGPEILIRIRRLTPAQRDLLRIRGLAELPDEPTSDNLIRRALDREPLVVLEICDFGTTGLGGPTRSDRIPVGTKRTDFINFLRNIGTPRDTEYGGGTYGFGKVALYRASSCSTIIVDTLPHGVGPDSRRLMGCHVGRSFEIPEDGMLRRFTGRHWWGVRDPEDAIVEPLTGASADEFASALGFPDRRQWGSGTSIMIIGFQAEDEDLRITAHRIVESLLWNFWPRLMADAPDARRFRCRIMLDDEEVPVPEPESLAPFDLFCKAMRAARRREGNDVRPIESLRPPKRVGTLAIEKGLKSPRRRLVAADSLVPEQVHHIALMRPIELVVKYLEGNPLPDGRFEWTGVFLASDEDEVERAFADSEPPAHDDWVPGNLPKGNPKRYVNKALKELGGVAKEMGLESTPQGTGSRNDGPPLARLAGRLGAVLEGVEGDGAGRRRGTGGGGGPRPRRARATRPSFERLETQATGKVAVFSTEVTQDTKRSGFALSASAAVAVEGAGLGHMAEDAPKPEVLSIQCSDGSEVADGPVFNLSGREGCFEIFVRVPDDCAVTAAVDVLEGAPST